MHRLFAIALAVLPFFATIARAADPPAGRIVFLGDSITYGGHYVEYINALLRLDSPQVHRELLDLGLPSETVSGLSEPNHAEGKFPRPALSERLARVLDKTRPALVVACYGMNDGIYYPPSAERLAKYQEGIRALREQATAAAPKSCWSRRRSSIPCRSKAKPCRPVWPSIPSPTKATTTCWRVTPNGCWPSEPRAGTWSMHTDR